MVNPSRFASDPRIDKPWGNTLREKLPRSMRLRYINWGAKERQQAFLAPLPGIGNSNPRAAAGAAAKAHLVAAAAALVVAVVVEVAVAAAAAAGERHLPAVVVAAQLHQGSLVSRGAWSYHVPCPQRPSDALRRAP